MRQTRDYVATKGRDATKVFRITEADAMATEWWSTRLFLALAKKGVEVPEGAAAMGLQAVAALGIRTLAQLDPLDAKPLLDEMMTYVQIVPDPRGNPSFAKPLSPGEVEEIGTVIDLRMEVVALHANFSLADFLSKLTSGEKGSGSPSTETSRPPSGQSSPQARQPSRNARPSTR